MPQCRLTPIHSSAASSEVQLIQDFRSDVVMVTPSYMLNIAEAFERQGRDMRASSLRLGIFGAER